LSLRQSSKELELKLLASPEDQRSLANCGLVARHAAGPGQQRQLRSVYYDTAEHSLAEAGYSLRVRDDGEAFVQTLKFAPPEEKSFSRYEWEASLQDSKPDVSRLPASAIGPVAARLGAKALVPVFSTVVTRQTIPLSFKGTNLELAFDQGVIAAGGCERPVSEIEIELQKGEAARLYELALALLDLAPLRWSTASKFERGHALARATPPPTSPAPSSALASHATLDDGIAAILAGCQRHLLANEAAAEDGRDPEGVHQMRVALRRMRAAFALFRRELGTEGSKAFDQEAKRIAHKLGACRNWDVFETETLPEATIEEAERRVLQGAAEPKRDESYGALRKALGGQRYARFQLSLGHWIECSGWRRELDGAMRTKLAEPLAKFAPPSLYALMRKARKKGKGFDKLKLRKRHRLRVALKELRYATEFFRPLFRKGKAKRQEKKLALLQKLLGKDSDAITTAALLGELTEASSSSSLRDAAQALQAWQTEERRAAAPEAQKAWAKFKKSKPFR
jgi:triphosphatase